MTLEGESPLTRLAFPMQSDAPRKLVVDASELRFVSPLELVGIAALLADGKTHRRRPRLVMPVRRNPCTYMERMDLVEVATDLGATVEGAKCAGPRTRTRGLVELRQVRSEADANDVSSSVYDIARRSSHRDDAAKAVEMVGELIDNALAHAECSHGCFVAAQRYTGNTSGDPRLEIAVADSGVGVLAHLRRRSKFSQLANAEKALARALEPNVTGAEAAGGRGNGLPDLLSAGARYGGRFVLRSDAGFATIRLGSDRSADTYRAPFAIQGTWAWIQLSLS